MFKTFVTDLFPLSRFCRRSIWLASVSKDIFKLTGRLTVHSTAALLAFLLLSLIATGIPRHTAHAGWGADYTREALTSKYGPRWDRKLSERLDEGAGDDEARFGLAMVRFVRAIEKFGRHHYRYGAGAGQNVPFFRLPVPENPYPQRPTYEIQRAAFQNLLDDLTEVEQTLSKIEKNDLKILIDLEKVRLHFGYNYATKGPTTIMDVARSIFPRMGQQIAAQERAMPEGEKASFKVAFDRADAYWLQGYCHLLSAALEFVLAHDFQESFTVGTAFFYPHMKLTDEIRNRQRTLFGDSLSIANAIAFIHEIRWQPVEPGRLLKVRQHLKQVVALSRQSWQEILAETDDDHEWIPSPKQKNATIPNMAITPERVSTWQAALDDFEAALDGRKLIPHWRFEKGINLRRVLEEPRKFDLILWMTGHAATPYLENGPMLDAQTWRT